MIYTNAKAPGIMLYYDYHSIFRHLPEVDAGKLIKAIFDFAEDGLTPNFEDNYPLLMVWDSIASHIEADKAKYAEKVLKTSYASYCNQCKIKGLEQAPRAVWIEAQRNGIDLLTYDRKIMNEKTGQDDIQEDPDLEYLDDEEEVIPF